MPDVKTTIVIADPLMAQVKREAARQGVTLSRVVEAALRLFLQNQKQPKKKLRPLPHFKGGPFLVDVDDRDALYDAMGGRR